MYIMTEPRMPAPLLTESCYRVRLPSPGGAAAPKRPTTRRQTKQASPQKGYVTSPPSLVVVCLRIAIYWLVVLCYVCNMLQTSPEEGVSPSAGAWSQGNV